MSHELVIILVAPQMGENIGAVARAMGNFGIGQLRIVTPRDGWPNDATIAMAAHARPIIDNAQIFENVAEAVSDCHFVVAATARQREMNKPHHSPKQWCALLMKAQAGRTALLLGRENNGLSNEEIAHAHAIVTVPVHPDCPSINLAQSAAILCYEWYQAAQNSGNLQPTSKQDSAVAPQSEIQAFFDQLESSLDEKEFWRVEAKKPKMWQNLRTLFLRSQLTSQEVQTLHGVVTALKRK